MPIQIDQIKHPMYTKYMADWYKWRLCYEGGDAFKHRYLKQLSQREDADDFKRRKEITPIPRFSGAAIDEIKNSILVRLSDVKRANGPKSYIEACVGLNGGVDKRGTTMSSFMGNSVLPEMLTMRRVGVFVDRPALDAGMRLNQVRNKQQYLYFYPIEDICSWDIWVDNTGRSSYKTLLLREEYDTYDTDTGLPTGCLTRFRRLWINENGKVSVVFYTQEMVGTDKGQEWQWLPGPVQELNLDVIPFVEFSISKSLMEDIADHQIALLNLESSDIAYGYEANFPFYVEQYDPVETQSHLKTVSAASKTTFDGETLQTIPAGTPTRTNEITVGTSQGRRYPKNLNAPSYIHPSAEPLKAAMEKEKQLKEDIRQLVGLSVQTLQPGHASAESKAADNQTLEAGLANIGLELQIGEQRIAEIWAKYEAADEASSVQYPRTYSLVTDEQRYEKATKQKDLQGAAPSKTFAKEVSKDITRTMFEHRIPQETLDKILTEIDSANHITSDPESIKTDIELGLVSEITASNARGYDGEEEVPKAREEHADRAARIVAAQTSVAQSVKGNDPAARGVKDLSADPKGADKEKQQSQRTPAMNKTAGDTKVRT